MSYRFERLDVWVLAINYARKIYRVSNEFPKSELFGLISQLKRAAISISSNIAEGSGSATVKDFCNFLDISIKSTLETVSQLLLAKELGFIDEHILKELYQDSEILIKKMRTLKAYLKKPRATSSDQQKREEYLHV